jgi:phosphatidylglycerophosphatase A
MVHKKDADLDPGYIVIDEACGIFLGSFILSYLGSISLLSILYNFLLFRIFDILKPFPIKHIEAICQKRKNTIAFGIMIDDTVAAIIATGLQIVAMSNIH